MNWRRVAEELRKSATDAQAAANRYAQAGERDACIAANSEAAILRSLVRALERGLE